MNIYVNDKTRELGTGQTLLGLVRELGLAERKGVALAVNGAVAPRTEWPARTLSAGDRVLVIQATQGG
jgi:sulfur carrier protein